MDRAIQYFSGANSIQADVITRHTGGGMFSAGGNDTLNAFVQNDQGHDHGRNELHLYAGDGSDWLNLNFTTMNQSYAWGHHVHGDRDGSAVSGGDPDNLSVRGTVDPLFADTFNFVGLSTVTGGRVIVAS